MLERLRGSKYAVSGGIQALPGACNFRLTQFKKKIKTLNNNNNNNNLLILAANSSLPERKLAGKEGSVRVLLRGSKGGGSVM